MNKLALHLFLAALTGLSLAPRLSAETVNLTADAYMPYTGDSSKGELGFMVELAKAIWEKKGYTVTYQSMGWKEAVSQARSGSFTAVVGANKDDVPDFLFPDVEEAALQGVFYKAPASDWTYSSPDSLTKICVGAIYDYKYSPEIAAYLTKNTANSRKVFWVQPDSDADAVGKFVRYLKDGRIQTFLEDRNVVQYFLKSYDRPETVVEAGTLHAPTKIYIAISPRELDGAKRIQELSDGMKALRASGELATILKKYGLADWQAAPASP
jgi:polar amino acid transport system substrate-binding protein